MLTLALTILASLRSGLLRIELFLCLERCGSHDTPSKSAKSTLHLLVIEVKGLASLANEVALWYLIEAVAQLMHLQITFLKQIK